MEKKSVRGKMIEGWNGVNNRVVLCVKRDMIVFEMKSFEQDFSIGK